MEIFALGFLARVKGRNICENYFINHFADDIALGATLDCVLRWRIFNRENA
jgi:hypothetical protein